MLLYLNCMIKQEEKAKQTLTNIIKQTGLKDQLKKHLRVKIAERLHNPSEVPHHINTDVFKHRLIVSAVKEYLDRIGCSYSSSIFCSQSGYEQKMLERVELKQLLNIHPIDESQSVVQYLFDRISKTDPFRKHSQCQTEQEEGHISIQQKFAIIDLQFRKVLQESNQLKTTPKHVCSEEKQWYEKELHRFKQFQSHKIKAKVGEEWRLKFQSYAQEMEAYYQRKLDKVRQKQKTIVQDFTRKQKNLAEKIQGWESSAKSRMELIQMKENTVMREKLNLQLQRKKALEQIKKSISQSKDKTREYQVLILNMEKSIAYEVGLFKLSSEQEQAKKQEQFKSKRKFVDEQYDKLMRIKDSMEFVTKENNRLVKENEAIRKENQEIRVELKDLKQDVRGKQERLQSLKEEFYALQNEKQQIDRSLDSEVKLRKKREDELAKTRKQLDKLRQKEAMQSESSFQQRPPRELTKEIDVKIVRMRQQRKKQIERFKLQL